MTALEYPQLVELSERRPAVLVRTVTGRWVPCSVMDLGVTDGFRMWRAVPLDDDLMRAEVTVSDGRPAGGPADRPDDPTL